LVISATARDDAENVAASYIKFPIQNSNSYFMPSFRGAPLGANPESRGVVRYPIEIPGSPPSGRALRDLWRRPGMTDRVLHSRGAMRPRFASPSRDLREAMERWEAPGVLR
jgi:hypothetical protein